MKQIIILIFIFFTTLVQSDIHAKEIIIGVEKLNYLPYYTHTNNQYQGYARELFDQFASDNGHNIHYKILPVARLFHAFVNHQVDFKFPDNPKWKQQKKQKYNIQYSLPVTNFTDGIMVHPEALDNKEKSFKKIGTLRGFTPWILMDQVKQKEIHIIENNTLEGLLQQGVLQRVDGCFVNINVARYFLKTQLQQPNALIYNTNLVHTDDHYYVSSIKYPDLIKQFNQWLQDNKVFHQQLKSKWGL
ncbi:MAG: transporter substrate-binding domain-containing protein [gamma proteobacterium symbiont of Taylorina sp.]|nr:transporter substrate-binding domain-containing protein [gamma proteobacterium symbiont of Taylorina sp.]